MQSPIPAKLVRIGDQILETEEDILIWLVDLNSGMVLIQRGDRFLERHSLSRLRIKSDIVLSRIASGGLV